MFLNFEMRDWTIYLFTPNNRTFGFIRHDYGRGFTLVLSCDFEKARKVVANNRMYFHSMDACKYYALAVFLEYGAE